MPRMDAGGGVRTIVIQVALCGDIWWWSYHDSLHEKSGVFAPSHSDSQQCAALAGEAALMRQHVSAVDDSLLEQMTSSLLEISSTFLVQQNELTEVKERLNKESLRVASIQELLTQAAQKHQDAVLAVIQNYENLATELPPATPPVARSSSVPLPLSATPRSASSSVDLSSGAAPAKEFLTVAQVHMPPAATQPSIFRQLPKLGDDDDDDDEGGIDYVANLQVSGGILGLPLVATADFVGTPSVQWHRSSSSSRGFVPIPGTLTAASNTYV
jgi:hypothetical protein